jgi:ABC-type multidrug transport system ATPase subunit
VLLGRNGVGKTTFIRVLTGQIAADEAEFPTRTLDVV